MDKRVTGVKVMVKGSLSQVVINREMNKAREQAMGKEHSRERV